MLNRFGLLLFVGLAATLNGWSQNTRDADAGVKPVQPSAVKKTSILIVPFEPLLYWSEIDKSIGAESKLSFEKIRFGFRQGLNSELAKSLKKDYTIVDLMSKPEVSKKDLAYIYQSISYSFDQLTQVSAAGGLRDSKTQAKSTKIAEGQLMVEANNDPRFMFVKITNRDLLPYLKKKYQVSHVLFIAQLDLKTIRPVVENLEEPATYRQAGVHYTFVNTEGTTLSSGIAYSTFPSTLNSMGKITTKYFSLNASWIRAQLNASFAQSRVVTRKQ